MRWVPSALIERDEHENEWFLESIRALPLAQERIPEQLLAENVIPLGELSSSGRARSSHGSACERDSRCYHWSGASAANHLDSGDDLRPSRTTRTRKFVG